MENGYMGFFQNSIFGGFWGLNRDLVKIECIQSEVDGEMRRMMCGWKWNW